jgi:hypothetical protein
MSLQRLLELDGKYIAEHQQRGLGIAELTWVKLGSPTERKGLIACLENAIVRCIDAGVEYPPILLRRKKELERGEWAPRPKPSPAALPRADIPGLPPDWYREAAEQSKRDYEERFNKRKGP